MITLSDEQQDVIKWFKENDTGHLAVLSMAGSGKSTLLHEIIKTAFRKHRGFPHHQRNLITCISFNRSLANQMKQETSERVWANTAHAILGKILFNYIKSTYDIEHRYRKNTEGEWRPIRVDDEKFAYIIVKQIAASYGVTLNKDGFSSPMPSEAFGVVDTVKRIVAMIHLNSIIHTDLKAIREGCNEFNIICTDADIDLASWAVSMGIKILQENGIYSNNEVLYLLSCYYPFEELKRFAIPSRILLLDECQDFSRAMHTSLRLLMTNDTQVIMVGDCHQSIYQFAYVSPKAIYRAVDYLEADTLNLSISFRCPNTHIDLVNELGINHEIKAAPTAIEGEVYSVNYLTFLEEVKEGALVMSRNLVGLNLNKRGVDIAIDLLNNGKPVNLSRWNIHTMVVPIVKNLIGKVMPNDTFLCRYVDKWVQREVDKLYEKPFPSKRKIRQVEEKGYVTKNLFKCFYENEQSLSIRRFVNWLDTLNTDQESGITIGSCHSAKGRTHKEVYIFNWDECMPFGNLNFTSTEDEIIC